MTTKNVKNLDNQKVQVNEEKIEQSKSKEIKFKLIVGAVIAVLVVGGGVIKKKSDDNAVQRAKTVVEYYGEDSEENSIIRYIELSEELNDLGLDKYSVDESLFSKYNISEELMSPEEIEKLIEQQKLINSYVSTKDITKQSKNVDIILNLVRQEQLVNEHIYTTGYSKAYSEVKEATKKYTGEVFGIDDYNNIGVDYNIENADGETRAVISYGNDSYVINNTLFSEEKEDIKRGARAINNANSSDDKNELDNEEYNEQRNRLIKEAIEQSALLNTKVEEEDLYNEGLAKKFK